MSTALDYVRYSCGIAGEEVAQMVDTLEAKRDELKADAMRYRWLKQYEKQNWSGFTTNMRHKEWDSAIDAAIAKGEKNEL